MEIYSRSHQSSSNSSVANINASSNNVVNPEIINNRSVSNVKYISCFCAKRCKDLGGLKAHQRPGRVIKSMSDNFVDNLEYDCNELHDNNNFNINVLSNFLDDTANEPPSVLRLTIRI